jgi:hypothetical protein
MNVIASDIGMEKGKYKFTSSHVDVGEIEARKASGEAHRGKPINLFVSWPPYECPITHKLLAQLPIGSTLFFIGEGPMGCTGSDEMFSELERNFDEVEYVSLPQWRGIHDNLVIYKKTEADPVPEKVTNIIIVHDPETIVKLKDDLETAEGHFRGKVEVVVNPKMIILRGQPGPDSELKNLENKALYISNGQERVTDIHPTLLRVKPTLTSDWYSIRSDVVGSDEFKDFIEQQGWLFDEDEWEGEL